MVERKANSLDRWRGK